MDQGLDLAASDVIRAHYQPADLVIEQLAHARLRGRLPGSPHSASPFRAAAFAATGVS